MKQKFTTSTLLITVILMDLLVGMEFDLFVPSFPELQSHFHLSPFLVESLLSSNFLGYCFSLFFVGALADYFGRKSIIQCGLLIFIIGSFFCLWASSFYFLIIGRFLQGLGIAAPAILSFLIIADAYSLKQQQFWMAMLNGVKNTSVAIAPVVGSYITLYFHWHGSFLALLTLSIITLIITALFIEDKTPAPQETRSLHSYKPLFQSRSLMLLMLNIVFMFIPYWVFAGMSPLLYMQDLHVSLAHFGYYQGALALTFAIGSLLFGLIMQAFSQSKMLKIASQIYIISLVSICLVTLVNSNNPLIITLGFLPYIIAQIIPSSLLVPLCLNYLPQAKARTSAILQGSQLIFSALGVECAGIFYQGSFRSIGIIISFFIIAASVTHFSLMRDNNIRITTLT